MVDQPVRSMSDLYTITPGTRVRVAHGVLGQLGTVRAVSPGHLMVLLDNGAHEIIDLSRHPVEAEQ
jgi:hypothetical protein